MADETSSTSTSQPKGKKKRSKGLFNFLLLVGIIVAIGLFVWAEQQRRDAQQQLTQTRQELERIQESTQQSGQAVADRVLESLRKHMDVPADPQPTVATIIDIDALRESSDFYQNADNGDHLVITQTRAILYDPERDIIIDVVPVQLEPQDQAQQDGGQPQESPQEGQEAASPAPQQEQQQDQDQEQEQQQQTPTQ